MEVSSSPRRELRRSWRGRPSLVLAWVPAGLVLVPALLVFLRAFAPVGEVWEHLLGNLLPTYLGHTILLVSAVTALALLFGVSTAWWVASYDFPGRCWLKWALLLPLAMPGYVAALAYVDATQASLVPLYLWLRDEFGTEVFLAAQDLGRWGLAVWVLASTLFPYVYLASLASFGRQSREALESARLLGARGGRLFFRVALPMSRPAVVAGASLVIFETINDYGVASYFGLSPLTVGIFRLWLTDGEMPAAIRMAALLLLLALAIVLLERAQRSRRSFSSDPGEALLSRRRPSRLGQVAILLGCLLPWIAGFALPACRLLRWALQSHAETDMGGNWIAAWKSVLLAAVATLAIVLAALLMTGAKRALRAPSLSVATRVGLMGYAFPSALVAVGVGILMVSLSRWPGLEWLALSASASGLVFAYFVRFLAVGLQPVDAGFLRVPAELHEVGRTLGHRPWSTLFRVDLPLAREAILAGGVLAFIDVFKELTLTLVLRPFNFETLATRVFRLADESRIPEAAVPAVILVSISLIGLLPVAKLSRRNA